MRKPIYLTKQGLLEAKEELDNLLKYKRLEVIQDLKNTRYSDKLLENAEYSYVKQDQAMVEKRIAELNYLIANAVIITDVNTDEVSIGAKVKLKFIPENEIETYAIVGTHEINPVKNKISTEAPIAKAILGKKVDDIVNVIHKFGEYKVKILEIHA